MVMNDWLRSSYYDLGGARYVADEEVIENDAGSREMEIYFSVAGREKVIADDDTAKAIWSMMNILSVDVRRDSSVSCSSGLHLQAFRLFDRICPLGLHIFVWGDNGLLGCPDGGGGGDVCVFVGLYPWA